MVNKLLNLKFLIKLYEILSSPAGTDVRRVAVRGDNLGCVCTLINTISLLA